MFKPMFDICGDPPLLTKKDRAYPEWYAKSNGKYKPPQKVIFRKGNKPPDEEKVNFSAPIQVDYKKMLGYQKTIGIK